MPNGQPCARSLTCKSHSMGAKRAVAGRSLPYDMLLAAYQKKNQAKQQKAAIDANAPLEDDDDNAGPVDSDEETAAVMGALAQWKPVPVVQPPVLMPIKRHYQLSRLHEQLQTATNGGRVNIFKVVGYGAQRLPPDHPSLYEQEDAFGEPDPAVMGSFSRRSSTFSIAPPPQRRPSVTGRA
jgi:SAGA-associated factor 73